MTIVQVKNVSKIFDGQTILDNINMNILEGQVVGLIGRNGSGKSMLFRTICGLVYPTEGIITVLGHEVGPDWLPQDIGAIIEHPGFLPQYSGKKNLLLLASIRGLIDEARIDEVIRLVGLDPTLRKPVRKYSMGMKQRLGLAQAIMERPRLLVLDEPTNGLDTDGVEMFYTLVKRLREQGVTILMASHIQEDIATLCDTVYRIERGRLTPAS